MGSNNSTSFIVVSGIIIFIVFTYISTINLLPDNLSSASYYAKIDKEMNAKIETLRVENGKLTITTSGEVIEYCIKATRSTPTNNSLCWKKIQNNIATISIFEGEKYYAWIKDSNGKISSPKSINSN